MTATDAVHSNQVAQIVGPERRLAGHIDRFGNR